MWREECKPLPTEVWLDELAKLVSSCAQHSPEGEDRAIRQAYHLARLSPLPVKKLLSPFVSESELESALEEEQAEEAAKLAIGSAAKIQLSDRSPRTLAILTFEGDEPREFEASSPALAIIGAWASFLTTVPQN